jgi:hypothetical protein
MKRAKPEPWWFVADCDELTWRVNWIVVWARIGDRRLFDATAAIP